jgi:predicted metalloprotease with PDZ domain
MTASERRRAAFRAGLAVAVATAALLCAASVKAAAKAPEADLSWRFHLTPPPRLAVEVELAFAGAPDGVTELRVSREWGGVDAGGEDIEVVRVTDERGRPLTVEHPEPNVWRVHHRPGERLIAAYRFLPNDHQGDRSPEVNRRPILNDHLLQFFGELGLLCPAHLDDDAPHHILMDWGGFEEAGWNVVTSFHAGASTHTFDAGLDELRQAIYLAGRMEIERREVKGRPVYTAISGGDWGFKNDEFADLVARVVSLERGFFDDYNHPYYLVTLIPVGERSPGSRSLGGTGLTNSFALAMLPGARLEEDPGQGGGVPRLLMHEMFHEWNGRVIGRQDPEELVYWFSEGFTDFYARRLLYRGGLIDAGAYAVSLNKTLAGLYASPVRNEPNARILADFWRNRDVKDLPYARGDAVAMILDHAIREASGGRRSLDDLMRDLVAAGRQGARISTESLLARFARETGPETAQRIRAIVEGGADPVPDAETFEPCLEMRVEPVSSYELGFDFDRSRETQTVTGLVAGSAAEKAGLREGQRLAGWSVRQGDATEPVKIRVRTWMGEKVVRYLPVSAPRPVPQFHLREGADADSCKVL